MRAWPRLRDWLAEDADGQRIRGHLTDSTAAWESLGRPESELYRGIRLAEALDWRERSDAATAPVELELPLAPGTLQAGALVARDDVVVHELGDHAAVGVEQRVRRALIADARDRGERGIRHLRDGASGPPPPPLSAGRSVTTSGTASRRSAASRPTYSSAALPAWRRRRQPVPTVRASLALSGRPRHRAGDRARHPHRRRARRAQHPVPGLPRPGLHERGRRGPDRMGDLTWSADGSAVANPRRHRGCVTQRRPPPILRTGHSRCRAFDVLFSPDARLYASRGRRITRSPPSTAPFIDRNISTPTDPLWASSRRRRSAASAARGARRPGAGP